MLTRTEAMKPPDEVWVRAEAPQAMGVDGCESPTALAIAYGLLLAAFVFCLFTGQ